MHAGRHGLVLLKSTVDLWLSNDAFQHAGALAFYTLFSLAPLLIILIAITGAVFGEEAARGEISSQIGALIGSQAAEAVEGAVRGGPPSFGQVFVTAKVESGVMIQATLG